MKTNIKNLASLAVAASMLVGCNTTGRKPITVTKNQPVAAPAVKPATVQVIGNQQTTTPTQPAAQTAPTSAVAQPAATVAPTAPAGVVGRTLVPSGGNSAGSGGIAFEPDHTGVVGGVTNLFFNKTGRLLFINLRQVNSEFNVGLDLEPAGTTNTAAVGKYIAPGARVYKLHPGTYTSTCTPEGGVEGGAMEFTVGEKPTRHLDRFNVSYCGGMEYSPETKKQ